MTVRRSKVAPRRRAGEASVEEHPKGSDKWRVRERNKVGKQVTVASGLSKAEATEIADARRFMRSEADAREGLTLTQFGIGFLDRRKRSGIRAVAHDKSQWEKHVDGDPVGALPVATLSRRDCLEWLDRKTHLAHRTRQKLRNLMNVALAEAVDRGLLQANPMRDVKVHRAGAARSTDDLEGILRPEEQIALLGAIPDADRPLVTFALCTGLRQAEQWHLQWGDVTTEAVIVRRSTGGLPPKSGKPRTVELLPPAVAALQAMSDANRNPLVVFPSLRGKRRMEGEAPREWKGWLKAAGIAHRAHGVERDDLWLVEAPPPEGRFDPRSTRLGGMVSVCVAAGEDAEAHLVDLAEAVSKALAFLKGGDRG